MSYKFMIPGKPSRWADTSGLFYRSYSTYTGAEDGPTPTSLVSGSLTCTSGSSTEISSFTISAGSTRVWRGYFAPDSSQSNWRFRTTSDDGSYLWLDTNSETPIAALDRDDAIVKNGGNHGLETVSSGDISLTAGFYYPIVLMAGNNTGTGSVTLEWSDDGGTSWSSNGATYLSHDSRWADGFGEDLYSASACLRTWVAVGVSGTIAVSTNTTSWTTYQLGDSTDTTLTSVAYGKDTSTGDTMWMLGTNNSYVASGSNPNGGAAQWSDLERIINTNAHRALQFGNNGGGAWVLASRAKLKRNVSGSWDVPTTDLNLNRAKGIAQDGAGKWALAATVYNTGRPSIWKSLDDGVTWSEAWNWSTNYGINYSNNRDWNIAYKSDKWVAAFPLLGIVTGSITAGPSDSGAFSRVLTSSEDLRYIAAGDTNTWMAIDRARNVYISTDNAATWSTTTSIPGSDAPSGLAYYDGTWVVTTDGTTDNIVKSDNNGSSWTVVASTGVSMEEVAVDVILP